LYVTEKSGEMGRARSRHEIGENAYTDSKRLKGRSILEPRLGCEDNIKVELKETVLSVSTVMM
jgi:hypothetical protein